MIILVLLFLRIWSFGVVLLWLFTIKNHLFVVPGSVWSALPRWVKTWELLRDMLSAVIWPVLLLSARGRKSLLSTLNLN